MTGHFLLVSYTLYRTIDLVLDEDEFNAVALTDTWLKDNKCQ